MKRIVMLVGMLAAFALLAAGRAEALSAPTCSSWVTADGITHVGPPSQWFADATIGPCNTNKTINVWIQVSTDNKATWQNEDGYQYVETASHSGVVHSIDPLIDAVPCSNNDWYREKVVSSVESDTSNGQTGRCSSERRGRGHADEPRPLRR